RRACTAGVRTSLRPRARRASRRTSSTSCSRTPRRAGERDANFSPGSSSVKVDRDAPTSDAARDAQYDAIVEWGIPDHAALQRLSGIQSPTLVIQGDEDLMIPTKLSHLMAALIPDVQIRI